MEQEAKQPENMTLAELIERFYAVVFAPAEVGHG